MASLTDNDSVLNTRTCVASDGSFIFAPSDGGGTSRTLTGRLQSLKSSFDRLGETDSDSKCTTEGDIAPEADRREQNESRQPSDCGIADNVRLLEGTVKNGDDVANVKLSRERCGEEEYREGEMFCPPMLENGEDFTEDGLVVATWSSPEYGRKPEVFNIEGWQKLEENEPKP